MILANDRQAEISALDTEVDRQLSLLSEVQ